MPIETYKKVDATNRRRGRGRLLKLALGVGAMAAARALVRSMRRFDLNGKVVLITGGSRGLGLVLAREFAAEGARLGICARDAAELDRARDELEARRAEVFTVTCDVSDRKQIEDTVLAVQMHFGTIDVLVNNAGIMQVGPLETMTHEDFERAMDVHFWAPLHATMAALPEMIRKRSGRIVNIASIGGKLAPPHLLPYDASKFALVGLSEGMRAELARYGVLVTTVCPGLMRTGSHLRAQFKGKHKKEYTVFTLLSAMPGISMSAERAARRIVAACKNGDPEVVLGGTAKLGAIVHSLFPGVTMDVFSAANRALPKPGGIRTMQAKGEHIQTSLSPSKVTEHLETAAVRNNEAA